MGTIPFRLYSISGYDSVSKDVPDPYLGTPTRAIIRYSIQKCQHAIGVYAADNYWCVRITYTVVQAPRGKNNLPD
jgi:hypothetical protein